jgi:hypothetical protein
VYIENSYRVIFYDGEHSGRFGLNRDDHEGGINYPIHVGTIGGNNGNGAYLTEGGTWTDGSSRTFKDNIQPVDGKRLLEKISSIEVPTWNYKGTDERHIGPMAEDFVEAFDVGVIRECDGLRDDHYLAARDVAGVALIGVQELYRMFQDQQNLAQQLQQTTQQLTAQTQEIEQLRLEMAQMQAVMETLLAQQISHKKNNSELSLRSTP